MYKTSNQLFFRLHKYVAQGQNLTQCYMNDKKSPFFVLKLKPRWINHNLGVPVEVGRPWA